MGSTLPGRLGNRVRAELSGLRGPISAHDLARRAAARGYARLAALELAAVGPRCTIAPTARFTGTRSIHLGESTNISPMVWFNTEGPGTIVVGRRVWIGPGTMLNSSGRLVIEDDVLIAPNCYISTDGHSFEGQEPISRQGRTNQHDVTVAVGAWLASGVVLLPGVTIGRGAVVGANSVVTSDVPARTVAAGAPARILRQF